MMTTRAIRTCIKYCIAATFLVPLLLVPSSSESFPSLTLFLQKFQFIFPFIVPKVVLFRSLVLIMLGLFISLAITDWPSFRVRLTPVTIAVYVFYGSLVISTFFGVDWYRSFWDNHERMLGLFTLVHYLVYYLVVTTVVREWKEWRWLLRFFLVSGTLVMIIGMLQTQYPNLLFNQGNERVSATLGNPIYYAGYGLFLAAIGYLLFIKETGRLWRVVSAVGALSGMVGIFISGTRGTTVALFVGVAVLLAYYFFGHRHEKKVRILTAALCIVGVCILAGLFAFRHTGFVQAIPGIGRLVNTRVIGDTTSTRFMAWGIAVDAWKEKPVIGWGPNNYYFAFNKYYRPQFLLNGWNETWFDNAHNIVMNTLAVQGGVGLLAYVALFVTGCVMIGRAFRRGQLDVHVAASATAFFAAHFIHNIFVFENPTSYLYFFFFLAFINQQTDLRTESASAVKRVGFGSVCATSLSVLLLIYATNLSVIRANHATLLALSQVQQNPALAVSTYKETMQMGSPHIDDIRNDFARIASQTITQLVDGKREEDAKKLYTEVYNDLQKNRELHPMDIRVNIQLAGIIQYWAFTHQDGNLLVTAEQIVEEALALSPKRQQIQYMLVGIKLGLGNPAEAVKILENSIANEPKVGEGWWRLALVYSETGNVPAALELIDDAERQHVPFDQRGMEVIARIRALKK